MKWSESGELRSERERPAERTSSLSPPRRLNCPTAGMKASTAALFLLILTLTITPVSPGRTKMGEPMINPPYTCCVKYQEKVLPRKRVAGYRKALNCHLPAIIFVTTKNREVCTNPNNGWVRDYLQDPNLRLLPPRNVSS